MTGKLRKLVALTFALCLVLATAPSAHAADRVACVTGSGCAASAEFISHGDKLVAEDFKADGYGVYVRYERFDLDVTGEFTNRKGFGSKKVHNMNLREGSQINFYVCLLSKSGKTSRCSDWTRAIA